MMAAQLYSCREMLLHVDSFVVSVAVCTIGTDTFQPD